MATDAQSGYTFKAAPRRPRPKPTRRQPPAGVFGPLAPADAPITRAQHVAQRRTQRAQAKLPARPVPAVPVLRHPTSRQSGTAVELYRRSLQAQAPKNQPARARLDQLRQVAEDLKSDPRTARAYRVGQAYAQDSADELALRLAHGSGFRGGTQRQRIAIGRELLAQHIARNPRAHEGRAPTRIQAAGLNINLSAVERATVSALADRIKGGQGLAAARFFTHDAPQFVGRAGSDLAHLPLNAVLGTYATGHAAVRAAQGDPRELHRLVHGLTHGAAGDVVRGDFAGAERQFGQHPLYSALEFSGLGSGVGRLAGAAARVAGRAGELAGAEGNLLARAGSTVREPLRLGDTGQVVQRRFSQDLLRKGGQVLADRYRARHGADPNVATGTRLTRELQRAADETAGQAEGMRRPGRGAAQTTARQVERKTPRAVRDLVQGAVEGELRGPGTLEVDLRSKLARLEKAWTDERGTMRLDARRHNREQRKAIETVLADPKKLEKARGSIFNVADAYKAHADQVEAELVRTGVLDAEQAKAARLRTYAVAHMGARYDSRKRAPEDLVARHDAARAIEQKAKARLDLANQMLEKAQARKARISGRNASQRGRDRATAGEPRTMLRREADRAGAADATARHVQGLRTERRQAEAAWRKARRDRVASDPKKYTTGLVDAEGRRITTRQIEEHIAADPAARAPAFVSHKPGATGLASHFVNWMGSRKTAEAGKVRTGESARVGGQDASVQALGDSLVRTQGVADAAKQFDRFVGDLGVKHPSGRHFTWDEAVRYNEHRTHDVNGDPIPGAVNMVPVRVVPAKYSQERAAAIMEGQGTAAHPDVGSVTQQRLEESLQPPPAAERGKQNVVLVPETQMRRLAEHQFGKTSEPGKVAQAVTGAFRSTVLPFSTKWLTGNTVEAALRLAINDTPVGLVASARAGRRVIKELARQDAEAAKAFDVRATGGLLFGGQRTVYGGAERFAGTKFERPAQVAAALHHAPVVKQITGAVGVYQRKVFALNSRLEHAAQVVAVGKEARREMQSMTGSWAKAVTAQKAAVEDVARGLVNTPAQVRYARAVDETLGKYNRFSPAMRRTTQTIAPFLPWYLNSLRFILHTLPVRHPVKTAVLASVEQTLGADFAAQHKNVPPGSLQSAIRTKNGGLLDFARFTPFGVIGGGAAAIADPFLPQVSSAIQILHGNAWTGAKLRLANGSAPGGAEEVGLALYAALESVLPGVAVVRRLEEHGQTAFDDSTVFAPKTKPDTAGPGVKPGIAAAANRVFNPLRPTFLHPKTAAGSTSGLPKEVQDAVDRAVGGAASKLPPDLQRAVDRAVAGR